MKAALLAALFVLPCLTLPAAAGERHTRTKHPHTTWKQKFSTANVTHDGHLTAQQAQTGYKSLYKHFAEIDTGNKGFITQEDVGAWRKAQRALHHPRASNPQGQPHAFNETTPAPPAATAQSPD